MTAAPSGWRAPLLLAVFVAVSLATRGPFLGVEVLNIDEATHILGSWTLLDGGGAGGAGLYEGFVDNKPPLLYVCYAAAQLLFGRGLLAVHLLTVLCIVPLTALGLSACFRHDRRGAAAGLIFLVFGAAFLARDMHAANCELLMLLPCAWAAALVRDEAGARSARRALTAGALIGLAALIKQHALVWAPALGLAISCASRSLPSRAARRVPLACFALGVLLPFAAAVALFTACGAGGAMLYWTVGQNLGYAHNPIDGDEAVVRVALMLGPFLIVTAGLWWAAWRARLLHEPHLRRMIGALLVCSLPPIFVGFRMSPHYFVPCYALLALAVAPLAAGTARRAATVYGGVALLGATALNVAICHGGLLPTYEEQTVPVARRVAARLRADVCVGGAVFVWGQCSLFYYYAYPQHAPASRFVVPQGTISGYVPGNWGVAAGRVSARDQVREDHWDQLMSDLEASRPTWIVDASAALSFQRTFAIDDFPRLSRFVREGYVPHATVDGVRLYRRRGCAGP